MTVTTDTIAPGTVREAITRLCRLQERIAAEATGYARADDCICGEGGFWLPGEWPDHPTSWRSSGEAIAFIERAVEAEIRRCRRAAKVARWLKACVPPHARSWPFVNRLFEIEL